MPGRKEPSRDKNIEHLWDPFGNAVKTLIARMVGRHFDAVLFEGRRSHERQDWLYGIGRTHNLKRKPVTWTLRGRHIVGKAADIISKSRGWNWEEFYDALKQEAQRLNLQVLSDERCHVQWQG